MEMKASHYVAIGMFLSSIALVIGSLDGWHDATKPQFLAAVVANAGAFLAAFFGGKPMPPSNGGGSSSVSASTVAKLPVVLLAAAIGFGVLAVPACSSFGPPPSVTTPAGKAAWDAGQFVQRAGELQSAAILANQQGALSDKSSVTVVQFTVGAIKAAKETPNGWQATVLIGYDALKTALSPADLKTLAVPLATVDALIAALGGVR